MRQANYDALAIIGIGPEAEQALHRFIELEHKEPMVFRCVETHLWSAFDSNVRSILSALQRFPDITEVWVLASSVQDDLKFSIEGNIEQEQKQVVSYLTQYLTDLQGERWLHPGTDESAALSKTVELLSNHPLWPSGVQVKSAMYDLEGHAV